MKIKNLPVSLVIVVLFFAATSKAQDNRGMATGNYAGIAGLWMNPASIADSRYKFDINLIGVNSYFNNNYLLVKNGAFVRRLFYKDPYNSSFASVKNNLLTEQPENDRKVYARVENNIQFPLSFMVTTGKKSAIAITMNNRTVNKVDSMSPALAHSLFSELRDPSLYGKDIREDSLQYNFLNWQEVGFTYSRVLFESDHHQLKMGVTLKWLGANAGGYIQADNAVINFKDSNTMSLTSPLIHYARTKNADFDAFRRKDLFNNLEDQSFGWDAGIVYEFRAKVKKFKFIDENLDERKRRDLNKYMLRVGVSIVDMGKFTLKKRPLTNDHSANIVNWDFSGGKAENFAQWDTAYARKISYINGASSTFTYRLPAALIANLDLHFFGGFYVNVAAKAPFESFKKTTDTYISANRWVAVTPRFESGFLGVYVPVSRMNGRTNIGATVKFGPLYLGSDNLAQILTNPTSYEADIHAGLRLSILQGKPDKISNFTEKLMKGTATTKQFDETQRQIDSLKREINSLRKEFYDTSLRRDVKIQINNYGGVTGTVERRNGDSVIIRNEPNAIYQQNAYARQDAQTDSLIKALAKSNVELSRLQKEQQSQSSGKKNKKSKKDKNDKQEIKVEVKDQELSEEMEKIRKQMAIQNAALISSNAAMIAVTNAGKEKKQDKTDSSKMIVTTTDSTLKNVQVIKVDTLNIHDTITIKEDDAVFKKVNAESFEPIFFSLGSSVISKNDKQRLVKLASDIQNHAEWRVEITGMTDASGTISKNRRLSTARSGAVSNILLQNGVKDNQVIIRSKLADTNNISRNENPRRVVIRLLTSK